MKLAISNIAWQQHDDPEVLAMLRELDVQGIEVAPTKMWADWKGASVSAAKQYRAMLQNEGFEIPAMQAILFGRPDLQVFQANTHNAFLKHMKLVADLAYGLGAKVLVFGSPKNRKRGQLSTRESLDIAVELFAQIGEICLQRECCIGWEHNPVEYGCDFITNVADARELVNRIDHPGVQLHIDSAGLHMCGGNLLETLSNAGYFCHYHASEPMLEPIAGGQVNHGSLLKHLAEIKYANWVSIEMKTFPSLDILKKSIQIVKQGL